MLRKLLWDQQVDYEIFMRQDDGHNHKDSMNWESVSFNQWPDTSSKCVGFNQSQIHLLNLLVLAKSQVHLVNILVLTKGQIHRVNV